MSQVLARNGKHRGWKASIATASAGPQPSFPAGKGWGWGPVFFAFTTDRGILSALSFVTAPHRQIAIVSTKFATIVQHGAGAIAAGAP
jgi:hypothetical protein